MNHTEEWSPAPTDNAHAEKNGALEAFIIKVKGNFAKDIIRSLTICSILFALIIHFLFKIKTGPEWLKAEWGAGDILTYVSTVALGLLAVWQNRRFKEENDVAQKRLEEISKQANELIIINKIIEIESTKLSTLKQIIDNITNSCDLFNIAAAGCDPNTLQDDNRTNIYNLLHLGHTIEINQLALCRELNDEQSAKEEISSNFIMHTISYCECAKKLINNIIISQAVTKNSFYGMLTNEASEINELKIQYEKSRDSFLKRREELLNTIVYENLSIASIRELLKDGMLQCKQEKNGEEQCNI